MNTTPNLIITKDFLRSAKMTAQELAIEIAVYLYEKERLTLGQAKRLADLDQISFQKGLMNMINTSSKKFQYIFSANFVDYFEHRKASVTCYLQEWVGAEFTSLQLIKSAYNKHYEVSRQQQCSVTV